MAGTDRTRPARVDPDDPAAGPSIVLVEPQLGENIGMAARAMMNCGLTDLRLVRPRDAWPNRHAVAASSGATAIIDAARVFDTTAAAIADLQAVYATTARPRDMTTDVVTPREAAARMQADLARGVRSGVLFGKEAKGLKNDDVALANAILTVPLNPAFTSLNLAQAVFAIGYEWFQLGVDAADAELTVPKATRPATKAELQGLFEHLEDELEDSGFFHVREKKPIMIRNIRNVLQRARFTEQEIRTFRGIVTALSTKRRR
ncbi:MAG: RNA methyltransferase [Rhodospirillaceae bacterium]